ncbi:hypothetical protein PJ311_03610 [Bacillus sp. CLL-7-23]|uniref:CBS domain-containing protein n=1 Tax=Bacillus changyiensis TaxID=3004103 RepID=A0ABT4X059_9BACI|nr:hypothetical protein [Bacillus changyiensis]MDA7025699.1 hypothetical protein [Bacillus changyiensis]
MIRKSDDRKKPCEVAKAFLFTSQYRLPVLQSGDIVYGVLYAVDGLGV